VSQDGHWTIHAVDTGTSTLDASMLTYTFSPGTAVRIPRVMWVIRGRTTIVVDTSVPPGATASEFIGEAFDRTPEQEPLNALHRAGVDPADVEYVVLTHLHWDHAGNCDLFPEATILVQEAELRYAIAPGRFFRKAFLAPSSGWGAPPYLVRNLQTVSGAHDLLPGLRIVPAAGHTPGSQALIVDTDAGSFAIAGDAICTYDSVDRDLPPAYHVDVDASMDTLDALRAGADHLLPSHDYRVFTDGPVTEIGVLHGAGRVRGGS
jgi:N-acyl homoserine lactone hydrolase